MDDNTIRVAVGLCLGSSLCLPHPYQHCGAVADQFATHGLSCPFSEGHHHRHPALNNVIQRALSSAYIPSRLEPANIFCSDRKYPDGVTMILWSTSKPLLWDATCPDTLAPSYVALATSEDGAVAAQAEERKKIKYSHLSSTHRFVPMIETLEDFSLSALPFLLKNLSSQSIVLGEKNTSTKVYLLQHLFVAIQRDNPKR